MKIKFNYVGFCFIVLGIVMVGIFTVKAIYLNQLPEQDMIAVPMGIICIYLGTYLFSSTTFNRCKSEHETMRTEQEVLKEMERLHNAMNDEISAVLKHERLMSESLYHHYMERYNALKWVIGK